MFEKSIEGGGLGKKRRKKAKKKRAFWDTWEKKPATGGETAEVSEHKGELRRPRPKKLIAMRKNKIT